MTALAPDPRRGSSLLIAHCTAVAADGATAYERLEDEVGGHLARLLVFALSGDHGRRGSSSP
ncbi:MAG TPA: hypothetical protein VLK36_01040 [Gaiellaceae bacterium]|nr:hypothetical protein [Gaiellaceae bacterium]